MRDRLEAREYAALSFANTLRPELRAAWRRVSRDRFRSAAIIALFTLSVGATSAILSVAHELLLRAPTGIASPRDLRRLYLHTTWSEGNVRVIRSEFSYQEYLTLARELRDGLSQKLSFAGFTRAETLSVFAARGSATARVTYATASYFSVLKVSADHGRVFTEDEDRMGSGEGVAVLGAALARRLSVGPSDLGAQVRIAGESFTVVGLLRPDFSGTDLDGADVWLPLSRRPAKQLGGAPWYLPWRSPPVVRIVARVPPETPQARIERVATNVLRTSERQLVSAGPDTTGLVLLAPLTEALGPAITPRPERAITTRLLGVAVAILLIGCANIANLLVVRVLGRRREYAVRMALGGTLRRILVGLCCELLWLAGIGSLLALILGFAGARVLNAVLMPGHTWAGDLIEWPVVAATLGVGATAALIAVGVPALALRDRSLIDAALRQTNRAIVPSWSRGRRLLGVLQVGFATALLIAAALYVRSLVNVRSTDVGFDTRQLVYGTVLFRNPEGHFLEQTVPERRVLTARFEDIAEHAQQWPEVEGVALTNAAPMRDYAMVRFFLDAGRPAPLLDERDPALFAVSPDYFRVSGFRLREGRPLGSPDRTGGAPAVVVNETAARLYWPGVIPLGRCVRLFEAGAPCLTVVGVVSDAHLASVLERPTVQLFIPLAQGGAGMLGTASHIVVRSKPNMVDRSAARLQEELRRAFPDPAVPSITLMATALAAEYRPWQIGATLFGAGGLLSLLISIVGVYSLLSYETTRRIPEIGVRVALGASRFTVAMLVMRGSLTVVCGGVALGVGVALAFGRVLAALLYGVSPSDIGTFLEATALVLFAGTVAGLGPAIRAALLDPVESLRQL